MTSECSSQESKKFREFNEFIRRGGGSQPRNFDFHYQSKYQIKKFADKLKDITCLLLGCTREQLEDREFKEKELGEEWDLFNLIAGNGEYYALNKTFYELTTIFKKTYREGRYTIVKMTPRKILQLLGTEAGRQIIHPQIWVNALFAEYKLQHITEGEVNNDGITMTYKDYPSWIITDMRFPNELKAVKDRGGITIRVNRGDGNTGNHPSETALDNAEFDYVVDNNGTIEELIQKIKQIIDKL